MKLYEIIDTEINTTDINNEFDYESLRDRYEQDSNHARGEYLKGRNPMQGSYAKVKPTNDPHTVEKNYRSPVGDIELDGYSTYILEIARAGVAKSNPFFPRVYNMNIIRDKRGNAIPTFQMETLVEGEDIDPEYLFNYAANYLFKNFTVDGEHEWHPDFIGQACIILDEIENRLSRSLNKSSTIEIKSRKLAEALELIMDIKHSNPNMFSYDMHYGNFMFRGTPNGYQLVITDPLADKGNVKGIPVDTLEWD